MSTDQRRTIYIQDLSRARCPVWVRVLEGPQRGTLSGSVDYIHAPRDLGRANNGGRAVIDTDLLLKRYQAERTATAEDCDQAVFGLTSAVAFFWEVLCRKGGADLLRRSIGQLSETEQSLLDAMTHLSSKPIQEAAE